MNTTKITKRKLIRGPWYTGALLIGFYKSLFVVLLLLMVIQSHAQKKQTIFVEVLGNAYLAASINYEIRLSRTENGPGVRIGYDMAGSGALPILVNQVLGGERHKFEIGVGTTIFTTQVDHAGFRAKGSSLTGVLGYRYHAQSGLLLRAGWTPIFTDTNSEGVWFGASLGWRF